MNNTTKLDGYSGLVFNIKLKITINAKGHKGDNIQSFFLLFSYGKKFKVKLLT